MARLRSIELTNFKNVGHGKIEFPSVSGAVPGADIVGIYGQNGSGKTAVIEALGVLERIVAGKSVKDLPVDLIRYGCDDAHLEFVISSKDSDEFDAGILVFYQVTITHDDGALAISRERLRCLDESAEKPRRTLLIDHVRSNEKGAYFTTSPKTAWNSFLAAFKGFATDFTVAERISFKERSSFIFSDEMEKAIFGLPNEYRKQDLSQALEDIRRRIFLPLMEALIGFSRFNYSLVVHSTINNARVSLNSMVISSWRDPWESEDARPIRLDIRTPSTLGTDELVRLDSTITAINTVLASLVPGLTLRVLNLGNELRDNGELGSRIEIVSRRGDCELPFRCESEGVKKIVSILGNLINVYNNEDCCVAIDEFDSGIFEFLLGEILEVLSEHGKGQLIFTAHNLRPLETLPSRSLVFTTTNPEHRYVGFTGLKKTNNLRDQYLRAINLGGQPETIYAPTSKYEIDSAFFEAGLASEEGQGPA